MSKRPPRRPPFRPPRSSVPDAPGGASGAPALRMLRQANRLMENDRHAQAYPLFKRQADVAARQGAPVRAAHLYLLAARARLEMGSPQDAMALVRQGIQLLMAAGQIERLRGLLPRLVQELEQHGSHDMAVSLRAQMSALLGGVGAQDVPAAEKGRLPARCPACSAPLRAQEVIWIDSHSAECACCGTPIGAE